VLTINADATDLGNNSVQTLDLTGIGVFHTLEIVFSSSGAVAQLNFDHPIAVEATSWGELKSMYRR